MQAEYLGKKWEVTSKIANTLASLGLSYELDTEEKESTNGKNQTNIKGVKAQSFSLSFPVACSLGTNPMEEFISWSNLKGKKDFFFLGGRQYGADQFLLKSVELNSENIYNDGTVLEAEITLSLEQDDSATKTNKKVKNPVKDRIAHSEAVEPEIKDGLEVAPNANEKAALLNG